MSLRVLQPCWPWSVPELQPALCLSRPLPGLLPPPLLVSAVTSSDTLPDLLQLQIPALLSVSPTSNYSITVTTDASTVTLEGRAKVSLPADRPEPSRCCRGVC